MEMTVPLVTFVSYCSRERVFADAVVSNARQCSDLVVVCIGTRLYSGQPEDVDAEVARVVSEQEEGRCAVIAAVYDVSERMLPTPIALHNLAREAGVAAARKALSFSRPFWALLLDGDEVPDGPCVRRWWQGAGGDAVRADPRAVHKMANHWMFMHPRLVAEELEDSVLLVHSDALLNRDALAHPRERDGIYMWHLASPLGMNDMRVERRVLSDEGAVMFWHFSWVRESNDDGDGGRSALKAKCANWGHRDDRPWADLIDAAFDEIEAGRWPERDFVHGYRLRLTDAAPGVLGAAAGGWGGR
jgi:hypothetical protein